MTRTATLSRRSPSFLLPLLSARSDLPFKPDGLRWRRRPRRPQVRPVYLCLPRPFARGGGGIFVLAGEGLQGGLACGSVPCRPERLLLERLLLPARSARQVRYSEPRMQGTRSSASSLTPTVSALCALAEWGLQIAFASRQRTSLTRTVGYLLTGRARTEARNSPPRRELITRREVSPVAARPPR